LIVQLGQGKVHFCMYFLDSIILDHS